MAWIFSRAGRLAPDSFPAAVTRKIRYCRVMQRSLMTTTPDFSGVRLLLP
jgi:hypothetical protein